jgi:hypothetical protein
MNKANPILNKKPPPIFQGGGHFALNKIESLLSSIPLLYFVKHNID